MTFREHRLRILVIGATGLIGSQICARLHKHGHAVIGLARRPPGASLFVDHYVSADLKEIKSEQDWCPLLSGIDAVINCAGVLQDGPRDSTFAVHSESVGAMFRACEKLGIRNVIHFSAIGVDRMAPTKFSMSKIEGDAILTSLDLDWVILRPSVVVGRSAYGGSALFRGLAALPMFPSPPRAAELQVVQLDDVADTVVWFLRKDAPTKVALEIAGPERLTFSQVVSVYRQWLFGRKSFAIALPRSISKVAYWGGDIAGLLGWRPPIRSNAAIELERGAIGDNTRWIELTGIIPTSLKQALAAEPASVQEKWFSKLYLLKPLVMGIFALFWVVTGLISFGPGWKIGMDLMREGGVEDIGPLLIGAGATADIIIGAGIAYRPTARIALWGALLLSATYVIIGTVLVPRLWEDPLGPMLKIWPIMVFNLVAIAILDDR